MPQFILYRMLRMRMVCLLLAFGIAAQTAVGQKTLWTLEKKSAEATEISGRSAITSPEGAGFATFKVTYQPRVEPQVSFDLIVETPERLSRFPFAKYDGPVDRTDSEFIRFALDAGTEGKS